MPAPDQQAPNSGEAWVASGRCRISNPAHHPQRIEGLRYRADSPIDGDVRQAPHICCLVDDLDAAIAGQEISVTPFEPGEPPFGRAAFIREHGIIVEYIQFCPGRARFDDDVDEPGATGDQGFPGADGSVGDTHPMRWRAKMPYIYVYLPLDRHTAP